MASTPFTVKTPSEVRDDILRTIRNGLISRGVTDPNVTAGSDFFLLAQALANEISVALANIQIKADQQMPDTASGEDLDRQLAIYGLTRRAAAGSFGLVTFESSATSNIVAGTQLIDSSGLRYEVSTSGAYANGSSILVDAVDTGDATNHPAGDILRWVAAPAFSNGTVTVGIPGLPLGTFVGALSGGVELEDDDTARRRLFDRLRNPPGTGNWSHVASIAEESTTKVQKAFPYPGIAGPATYSVAVTAYPTKTSKSRQLDAVTTNNTVAPFIKGKMPEFAQAIITTVADDLVDLALFLDLPESPQASPAGPGGGWTNGNVWPALDGSHNEAFVSAVTDSLHFTIEAADNKPPVKGVSKICFLSPLTWTLYTAIVTDYTHPFTDTYVLTIDQPFTGIAIGNQVFPHCQNVQAYVDAVLAQFALMGPGEKVASNATAFQRGFRHPLPSQSWPYALDSRMLRAVENVGDEVLSVSYSARYIASQGNSNVAPFEPLHTTPTTAPKILVPNNIGLYRNFA